MSDQGIIQLNNEKEIEKYVGIEAYTFPKIKGIGGKYKYSYRDFIVKEITKNGDVLSHHHIEDRLLSNPPKHIYTKFILKKNNMDTFEAIKLISNALKVPINKFSYSGLKDKRSISFQKVAVMGDYGKELKELHIPDLSIGFIHHSSNAITIGSNKGNAFIITIRDIQKTQGTQEILSHMFKLIKDNGFLNYYGLQRFGTFRPNSHLIGKYILENSYKKAFHEFVLQLYSSESKKSQKVRKQLLIERDFKRAYDNFPESLNYERTMIKHLITNSNDYKGCVNKLPKSLVRLLISSFQSYIFNKLISLRVKKGFSIFEPEKGDILSILDDYDGEITQVTYEYGREYDHYLEKAIKLNRAVIVVPMIGYETDLEKFPLFNELFDELLKTEDFDKSIFQSNYFKEFDFKGTFRAMINKPSDLELLEVSEDEIFTDRLKIKIKFSLLSGTYATMLLRELMK